MKEALLYEKLGNNQVRCFLCNHYCKIREEKFGFCAVRQNIGGTLYTQVYGKIITSHVDPIEKKPLYHFLPGSTSFSIATIGCNFRCGFCQNWEISQNSVRDNNYLGEEVSAKDIVEAAIKNKCKSISYTYSEPTIFFEFALDIAKLAKEKGLYNNFVTNGYMTEECITMIRPYLDAANIDLKFFRDSSYRKICAGALTPVLNSIRLMYKLGIWVEITTLIVPGENDSQEELQDIAGFIAGVDKNIPWHISRFHPDYKFSDHKATPEAALKKAEEVGQLAGLNYIYIGNVCGFGNDTYCPSCKKPLIRREYFNILEYNIKEGKCPFCNTGIAGHFS
ncbi:MAG: AmmeMemoRadiSam system radical SAM enzyme [Omnitrophica WOR_2 bacterium RBG_13_41_10]|nr:MAG: AmmeMemoRadiSam system radical SAM enzyme [Omnitrophica WOR_2 bacterium RBG_13_41_10]